MMTALEGFKVRPSPDKETKDAFKILLSPAALVHLGLKPGDVCSIQPLEGRCGTAIAWNAKEKIRDDVVQTSLSLQTICGLKLNEKVSIEPCSEPCGPATDIVFCGMHEATFNLTSQGLDERDRLGWQYALQDQMNKSELIVSPGLIFEAMINGTKGSFKVQKVNSSQRRVLYHAQQGARVHIATLEPQDEGDRALHISNAGLGGLKSQVDQVNRFVRRYSESCHSLRLSQKVSQQQKNGLIIYGASGTGKSLILRKISEVGWKGVFHIDMDRLCQDTMSKATSYLNQVVSDALGTQPSVLIIDALDGNLSESGERCGNRLSKLLCGQFDRLVGSRTYIVGAVTRLSEVDQSLKRVERFAKAIELPVPDAASRSEMLRLLMGLPRDRPHPMLDNIGMRTHGFVGSDLELLVMEAVESYVDRMSQQQSSHNDVDEDLNEPTPEAVIADMAVDFKNALSKVHPSAMHDIFVESPNVRWTDIGGQKQVKEALEDAIVWPIKVGEIGESFDLFTDILQHHEAMKEGGASPKKGLLLYGPPGCSKTMVAKAAATESEFNFLTVKGPELMSMYVGESERALREVFRKAYAVKPSIIFFDEIDAIGSTAGTGQQSAVQTVTTLLNELDGFQAREGVFVLAATNKPEMLDLALIRAGRLDETLYVGLPDYGSRLDIFRIQMGTMPLDIGIDRDALAAKAEGFSGAEIIQICEKARWAAMKEAVGLERKIVINQRHFESALEVVQKSVTPEMVHRYHAWGAARH